MRVLAYLQRYILSAAHCFCKKEFGKCRKNNGKKLKSRLKSGHFRYGKATRKSRSILKYGDHLIFLYLIFFRIDQEIVNRIDILAPGDFESYDMNELQV